MSPTHEVIISLYKGVMYGGNDRSVQDFVGERNHVKHKGVGGMYDNIKMDLKEKGWQGVDRIHLAQDTDTWAVVSTVMNLRML
jgi:hypothetical protein